jgi:hypothetical protein
MKTQREITAEMPISYKLRFVREAWEREKLMRLRVLKGDNQRKKLEEADIVLDCLDALEAHIKGVAA